MKLNHSPQYFTQVGNVISEAWASNLLKIKGPPEPPAAVKVEGNCRIRSNVVVKWKKGEELDAETRGFYIEFSTNSSSSLGRWFGGMGDPLMPNSEIKAEPGTQDSWDVTQYLVPGANLIFRVRGFSDHLVGRASRPSEINKCVTQPDSKSAFDFPFKRFLFFRSPSSMLNLIL